MIDFDSLDLDNMDNSNLDNSDIGTESTFDATFTNEFGSGHFTDHFGIDQNPSGSETHYGAHSSTNNTLGSLNTTSATPKSMPWDNTGSNLPWDNEPVSTISHDSTNQVDFSQMDDQITFKGSGYTQDEINHHIEEAKQDISHAKSQIRSHTELLKNSNYPETEKMHIQNAERDLKEAQSELSKWQSMKPSK